MILKKKFLALLIACLMMIGMMPISVMADNIVASGTCGNNLTF